MTIEEWKKDFKAYINELQMPRDDYKGIMEYIDDAIALLKEQYSCENCAIAIEDRQLVVRCKNCSNWIPGYITDDDDFIPPKCGKYQQMVGHSADDYCSLAERE